MKNVYITLYCAISVHCALDYHQQKEMGRFSEEHAFRILTVGKVTRNGEGREMIARDKRRQVHLNPFINCIWVCVCPCVERVDGKCGLGRLLMSTCSALMSAYGPLWESEA